MKLENLEIVQVINDGDKIIFTCLDTEKQEIHEIIWRLKKFDAKTKKFEEDAGKYQQVVDWCKQYFDLTPETITEATGRTIDVFTYDTFDSFWESDKKFDLDMKGQVLQGVVKEVLYNTDGIAIRFDYDGNTYRSNMKFTELLNGVYYVKPMKRARQLQKFEDNFGITVDERDKLIGKNIMFEVKAMGKNTYVEIKPFPKKK